MLSLRARLLIAATLVLAAFLAVAGLALERSFRDTAVRAERDRLQGMVYALLGAAELTAQGDLFVSDVDLPDPRLRNPLSGLEAAIFDEQGRALWRSASAGEQLPALPPLEVGQWHFDRLPQPDRFAAAFGVRWLGLDAQPRRFAIAVFEDPLAYAAQVREFRLTLWGWLAVTAGGLLAAQIAVLAWSLWPLRRLVREIGQIEAGEKAEIASHYPPELQSLTGAFNAVIRHEHARQSRYRNALGDLAHSLKTPLAVLRGLFGEGALPAPLRDRAGEQLARMQDITDHQLRKAATAGPHGLGNPIAPRPLADKVSAALAKVYAGKGLRFVNDLPAALRLRVDESDLYELIGNLLDNAAKWGKSQVRILATPAGPRLQIHVDDDGPGFPADAEKLMQRGVRADTRMPGQGLGLAAADDIVRAYGGTVALARSPLGGARVTVELPIR